MSETVLLTRRQLLGGVAAITTLAVLPPLLVPAEPDRVVRYQSWPLGTPRPDFWVTGSGPLSRYIELRPKLLALYPDLCTIT